MMGRIGIGIVTYNRRDVLRETVRCVREFTARDDVDFVVADDGSTDGTAEMLREEAVPFVTGVNMGIAWNKNRALYLLAQMCRSEVVILLEDDTQPNQIGWERNWVEGARLWGHVNLAGAWLTRAFVSGAGTPDDPFMSKSVTAQCAAYSTQSLDYGGYYDPRFKGYGHEHVEHSRRLIRVGYGGTDEFVDGAERVLYAMLNGAVTVRNPPSYFNKEQAENNLIVARKAMADRFYRAPWQSEAEMQQFRSEITEALARHTSGFNLRPFGLAVKAPAQAPLPVSAPVGTPEPSPTRAAPVTETPPAPARPNNPPQSPSALDRLRDGAGAVRPRDATTPGPTSPPKHPGLMSRFWRR